MTSIRVDKPVVTLINVFSVEPQDQARLVDLLAQATRETMRKQPGFVSANIHRSLDGRHVANYAQWRREEDFQAMLANPDAQVHMRAAGSIAKAEPRLYTVAYCDSLGED